MPENKNESEFVGYGKTTPERWMSGEEIQQNAKTKPNQQNGSTVTTRTGGETFKEGIAKHPVTYEAFGETRMAPVTSKARITQSGMILMPANGGKMNA